ncbi:hypothetical protein OHC33_000615 [Knufia fluminis]|uniref:T6SS Phospholipase effector Tle1-like catalytic domain-containing protein n=1 Tax=Knufia fluminis TaxID=191047 RepID=A0AAN8I7Z2_9EURO|nr:hypothetical protein OHC33_000615 [Knufia fluminis]
MAANTRPTAPKKRLVICMDGTGNTCIKNNEPQTNVVRLGRCIADVGRDGSTQQVYYHYGIGTSSTIGGNLVDSAIGSGLDERLLHAYHYICLNFSNPSDEIYLVGFSRGAYTAYVLAAFLCRVGLLTKPGLSHMNDLYEIWQISRGFDFRDTTKDLDERLATVDSLAGEVDTESLDRVKTAMKQTASDSEGKVSSLDEALNSLHESNLIRRGIRVEACILWDTVSALAVPMPRGIKPWRKKEFDFVNRAMPQGINNIFHALSLNEKRRDFLPVVFSRPPEGTNLRQCWFLGVHSNVGGSTEDIALCNVSLGWMWTQLTMCTRLQFDHKHIARLVAPSHITDQLATSYQLALRKGPPDAARVCDLLENMMQEDTSRFRKGKIDDSYTPLYKISGAKPRTIETFFKVLRPSNWTTAPSPAATDSSQVRTRDRSSNYQAIHMSVRLMLGKNWSNATCPVLSDYEPQFDADIASMVWRNKAEADVFADDPSRLLSGMHEDKVSLHELALMKLWYVAEKTAITNERTLRAGLQKAIEATVRQHGLKRKVPEPGRDSGNDSTLISFLYPLMEKAGTSTLSLPHVESEREAEDSTGLAQVTSQSQSAVENTRPRE